jgi:hypothetical protein
MPMFRWRKDKPGYYRGRHFTTYCGEMEALKRAAKHDELEELLVGLIAANEAESLAEGGHCWVAPAYYRELADLYRDRNDFTAELTILEQFSRQNLGPTFLTGQLLDRLEQARLRHAEERTA